MNEQERQSYDETTRARLHKLADSVQNHEIRLAEQKRDIERSRDDIKHLQSTTVSQSHVDLAVKLIEEKIHNLEEIVKPIRDNIVWGTRLVVGSIIAALIALVIRMGQQP